MVELARSIQPRQLRPSVVFILFDGEESPKDATGDFESTGLRGSKVAAPRYKDAEAMILLDFVADRDLSLPREATPIPRSGGGSAGGAARRDGGHLPNR